MHHTFLSDPKILTIFLVLSGDLRDVVGDRLYPNR